MTTSDGVELAVYELAGGQHDRDRPTILINHATGMCGAVYRAMAKHLADRYRVVAFDARGHGRSGRPADDNFDWLQMADDVLAVRRELTGDVHGFGHSMGGATALLAQAAQPQTYRSMFVFEPIVFPADFVPQGRSVLAVGARLRRAEFDSRADAMFRFASRLPFSEIRADVLADYVDNGFAEAPDATGTSGSRVALRCHPHDEARVYEADEDSRIARIAHVDVPVVVAAGSLKIKGAGQLAPSIAAALSQASFVEYQTLDHFGPYQDPARIAADLDRHIRTATA